VTTLEQDLNLLDAHMGVFNWRNLRRIDWPLLGLVCAMAGVGFVMLLSSSTDVHASPPHYVRQMLFFLIGLVLALGVVCTDYRFLVAMAPLFYVLALALLVAVLYLGIEKGGATRWFALGPVRLQPSEIAKFSVVYMLAWYLTRVRDRLGNPLFFAGAFLIGGIPIALIKMQPDLSTGLLILPIVLGMLWAAGCRRWHLVALGIIGIVAAPLAYTQLKPYQQERIKSFMAPKTEMNDANYQQMQATVAVGSGELAGKGFMKGTQTHLKFLPDYHTDFIFALVAEEHGFIGAATVLGLMSLLLFRGLVLAAACPDLSGALLAVGSVLLLAVHTCLNAAVATTIVPVTGLPFPFLSYGGSYYLVAMLCIGTILSVNVRRGYFD
jgi:rod shape determining protein RodA